MLQISISFLLPFFVGLLLLMLVITIATATATHIPHTEAHIHIYVGFSDVHGELYYRIFYGGAVNNVQVGSL